MWWRFTITAGFSGLEIAGLAMCSALAWVERTNAWLAVGALLLTAVFAASAAVTLIVARKNWLALQRARSFAFGGERSNSRAWHF